MKSKCAFTLIEVVVVIGIIAVLTIIIFPSITQIRAKNRDTERVADIAAIQLGLSLYKNQSQTGEYPETLPELIPGKYVTSDSLSGPNDDDPFYQYQYIPLRRYPKDKCTFYHLGVNLELSSAQIDTADTFTSRGLTKTNDQYYYCDDSNTNGIDDSLDKMYDVHP